MQRICIGITNLTPGWKSLLDQIGVWYEELGNNKITADYYSVIINNSKAETFQKELISYLYSGGSVLNLDPHFKEDFGTEHFRSAKESVITNSGYYSFLRHIPFIDITGKCFLKNGEPDFKSLISFKTIGKSNICFLGIDPGHLISDNSYRRKRFFFKDGMHPDELVSSVSKGNILELLISLLKELHFRRSLPFVSKWTSPSKKPVFAFRIDSDYGDQKSIESLYQLAESYHVPATWFLHVRAHEDWLSYFKKFKNQEIALHGYEHGTSGSYEHIYQNIERGLQLLNDFGLSHDGFCVPYGIWNNTLAEVLKKYDFSYTSEFTVAYDALPFYPVHDGQTFDTLQIPVHPICTGSLNRKDASVSTMSDYFLMKLFSKINRFEPAVFYHHPLQPGLDAIKTLFEKVDKLGLTKLSFSEFAGFWQNRNSVSHKVRFDSDNCELIVDCKEKLYFQVSMTHKGFDLIPPSSTAYKPERKSEFNYSELYIPSQNDITDLKSRKLNLLKTSFFDWKNRKSL